MVLTVRAGFEQVDRALRADGGHARRRRRGACSSPSRCRSPARSILAGALLGFARALGEFGATIVVAGGIPGQTQTLAVAIFNLTESGREADATRAAARSRSRWRSAALAAANLVLRRERAPMIALEFDVARRAGRVRAGRPRPRDGAGAGAVRPVGRGKTTLLEVLAGLRPADAAWFASAVARCSTRRRGIDVPRASAPRRLRAAGRAALPAPERPRSNLAYGARDAPRDVDAVAEMLESGRAARPRRPPACRAASASASRSAARWPPSPRCCCSTSRSARSTRRAASASCPTCCARGRRWACRWLGHARRRGAAHRRRSRAGDRPRRRHLYRRGDRRAAVAGTLARVGAGR